MENVILEAIKACKEEEGHYPSDEELASWISKQLKASLAEQLIRSLEHLQEFVMKRKTFTEDAGDALFAVLVAASFCGLASYLFIASV